MLPSALVSQLEQGMKDFLRVSFWSSTPGFESMLERFLAGEDAAVEGDVGESPIFRGPFVSIDLAFEHGESGADYFKNVPMEFPPYRHQEEAFDRLSGPNRRNTLVATGTGSGKTETFLYPILAHCERRIGCDGIKAILIYPMNALANDQAARFAERIWNNDKLRGKVTCGLYVGQSERVPHAGMDEDHVITDKDEIRSNPPDVLLTNYKMLDYLLSRPRDQKLWRDNEPETLQFLVVDELHTFDGAQGTDLACLIRRLKARLGTPEHHLACVGTSATLGTEGGRDKLLAFARSVFAEPFDEDSVVGEARVDRRVFADAWVGGNETPGVEDIDDLNPANFQDVDAYVERQQQLWFDGSTDPVQLGDQLREHPVFQNLVRLVGNETASLSEVVQAFLRRGSLGSDDEEFIRLSVLSLLSLVSHARTMVEVGEGDDATEVIRPLVEAQIQFWQREMRRMVASVGPRPGLRFYDDLSRDQRKVHLPVIYCRECGLMGWATMRERDAKSDVAVGLKSFYQAFFRADDRVDFMFPGQVADGLVGKTARYMLDTGNLTLHGSHYDADDAQGEVIEVAISDNERSTQRGKRIHRHCPQCSSHDSLSLLGFQAATLTSAYINQLYASNFNDDKKLLTFSDSVQDASHRAGFFGARTWRFNLRIAVQRVIDAAADPVPIGELADRTVDYWRDLLGDEEFVATFIAPNMRWLRDYEALRERGELPEDSDIIDLIRRRIHWEVHSEFSFRAAIGRSLPKVGASTAYVKPDRMTSAVEELLPVLQNEIGGLRDLEAPRLRQFLVGFVHHLMERGAIYHSEVHSSYLESGGDNTYVFGKKQRHMPDFGSRSRLPAFLASRSTRRFDALTLKTKASWYEYWLSKNFEQESALLGGVTGWIYEQVLSALIDSDVVERRIYGGTDVWGIRSDALLVASSPQMLRQNETGQVRYAAETDVWDGMPSLTRGVAGTFRLVEESSPDYYARLYGNGQVHQIVAAEHTGLLEREEREELEEQFKSDSPEPWFPNLLSCTPTLEMGVDVGDLSTAILCSVPPSQANYLQRIGRAGRRDGNALILTFAEARPHDLYFFAEPDEMIAGDVDTPGIFLNASAVLERQLTAYCLDRWAASGISSDDLPRKLGTVIRNIAKDDTGVFPHNFLHFVESVETQLLDEFLELFADAITESTREHLTRFMTGGEEGGGLDHKILSGLGAEKRERRQHKRDLDRTRRKLGRLDEREHLGETDKELKEDLKREKEALQRLIRERDNRPTMEFFTSEGLIPNYAFPEAGVSLKSVIWRRRADDEQGEGSYENTYYEYERPARSALKELAPGSRFYAGGRQVEIDRVDVDESNIEWWQFCDNCHFYDPKVTGKSEYKTCPACGSAGFGDVEGQRHQMLRLRQVYANASDRRSRIGDERDERQPTFYNRQMLVHFDPEEATQSWSVANGDFPFGYEYATKTQFLDINFGFFDDRGEKISIAGEESVRPGFEICADCGKLQPEDEEAEAEHTYGCPSRDKDEPNLIDCLFLYRRFSSESLRLLLPFVDRPGYRRSLHSFVAALEMGLEEYYEGEVDHLETTVFEESGPENSERKQYLVIYDTVPGGTGYLKELLRGEEGEKPIFEVFQKALSRLKSCVCNREGENKDGCYRCLYAYRNSYDMPETSREAAVDILTELLEVEQEMEQVDSLGDISVSGLFDSALEARFIEALRRREGAKLTKTTLEFEPGFRYRLQGGEDAENRVAWELRQQRTISPKSGVATGVEVDLLARFARGVDANRELAMFTDGFQFHEERIGRDLYQRMALVQSGRYWTWSLTWDDVEDVFSDRGDYYPLIIDPGGDEFEKAFFDHIYRASGGGDLRHRWKDSSLQWLHRFFDGAPDVTAERWSRWAMANAVAMTTKDSQDREVFDGVVDELRQSAPPPVAELVLDGVASSEDALVGRYDAPKRCAPFSIYVVAPHTAITEGDESDIRMFARLDDRPEIRGQSGFRETWNGFLRLFNLFQFLPKALFTTATSVDELDWHALLESSYWWQRSEELNEGEMSPEWEDVRKDVFAEYEPVVDALWAADVSEAPVVGYELEDDRGRPTDGLAELAWPQQKVAVVEVDDQRTVTLDGRDEFVDQGWQIVEEAVVLDDPSQLIEKLSATD